MQTDSNGGRQRHGTHNQLGAYGELLVCHWLIKHGFTIIARNYALRGGEIDIVARKKETVIFVEVKARTQQHFNLSEVITFSKQRKITTTARHYIACNAETLGDVVYRFDVALVCVNSHQIVSYIENAFYCTSES